MQSAGPAVLDVPAADLDEATSHRSGRSRTMLVTVQHLDVRASTYYKRQAALGDAARGRLTQSGGGE